MVKEKYFLTFSLFHPVDYVLHSYHTQKMLETLLGFSLWYKPSKTLQPSLFIPVIKIDQAVWDSLEIQTVKPNFPLNKLDQF